MSFISADCQGNSSVSLFKYRNHASTA